MQNWRIHLGVHKTATTHLQAVLDALDLEKSGLGHIAVAPLRAATGDIFRPLGLRRRLLGRNPPPLFETITSLAGGHETLVLSEENWIGEAFEGAAVPPYPDLAQRLGHLRSLPGHVSLSFFLAVRQPGEFATSVAAEALRHHPGRVRIEEVRKAWLRTGSPWLELVGRLRDGFPEVPLTIWRYEDYRENAKAVVERLVGHAIETLPDLPDPVATKRPSAETVAMMARGRRSGFGSGPKNAANVPPADDVFRLFNDDELKQFEQAYAEDLAAIEAAFPGVLLSFPKVAR